MCGGGGCVGGCMRTCMHACVLAYVCALAMWPSGLKHLSAILYIKFHQ